MGFTSRAQRGGLVAAILAGAAGFVVNGFSLSVFPGAVVLFGGVFYLLLAGRGPAHGFVAAGIAASRTIWVFGNPFAFPIFALEGLFVGLWARRFRSILWADVLFWCVLGFPLFVTVFVFILPEPSPSNWAVAVKNPLNGILNALIAELLLSFPVVNRWLGVEAFSRAPLRSALRKGFVLVAALPVLLMSAAGGRYYVANERAAGIQSLESSARTVALIVDRHIEVHRDAIEALAATLSEGDGGGELDPTRSSRLIDLHNRSFKSFLTMIVVDADGLIVAASPPEAFSGEPIVGVSTVADRDYFKVPVRTGKPYISDAFVGRGFGQDVIVAVSAPIRTDDGRTIGIVEGSLNLEIFAERLTPLSNEAIIVLDRSNRVVFASPHSRYTLLDDLTDSPLLEAAVVAPAGAAFDYQQAREGAPATVTSGFSAKTESAEWRIIAQRDAASLFRGVQDLYLTNLLAAFSGILLALFVAHRVSHSVTSRIERLLAGVRSFRVGSEAAETDEGSDEARTEGDEVEELRSAFEVMASRLREAYGKLEVVLAEREGAMVDLDSMVQKRTKELSLARRAAEVSQKRYADLVEGIDAIVWEADARSLRFSFVSGQAESILGYPVARWIDDDGFWEGIIHPDDRARTVSFCQESTMRGADHQFEYRALAADGRTVWLRDLVRVILGRDGRARTLRGVMFDISEQKRAAVEKGHLEAQLRQAQKMEAVGQLAGGVAHDFNNLLTVINGYADVMLRKLPPEDPLRHEAEDIFKAGEKAAALTRQLLAFSRTQVLEPTVLDLNRLVKTSERLLKRALGGGIAVVLDLENAICPVKVDSVQIEQVVLNLALNARDAMPGGGELSITTTTVDADRAHLQHPSMTRQDYVRLSLADTGTGMPPELMERIFEPFFTTKRTGEGSGLGLSTAYGIVEQSGGYIWVESEPGLGSRFDVYLPRSNEPVPGLLDDYAKGVLPLNELQLLMVEDDDMVRELTRAMLESAGCRVEATEDAEQALGVFARLDQVDAIVTDFALPGMDGIELAERLSAKQPGLKVLLVSGYGDQARVREVLEKRDWLFLSKPFTRDSLVSALSELVAQAGRAAVSEPRGTR